MLTTTSTIKPFAVLHFSLDKTQVLWLHTAPGDGIFDVYAAPHSGSPDREAVKNLETPRPVATITVKGAVTDVLMHNPHAEGTSAYQHVYRESEWLPAKAGISNGAPLLSFEEWWEAHGQYCRAGGGEYEKTFACHAYEYISEKFTTLPSDFAQLKQDHQQLISGARESFINQYEVLGEMVRESRRWRDLLYRLSIHLFEELKTSSTPRPVTSTLLVEIKEALDLSAHTKVAVPEGHWRPWIAGLMQVDLDQLVSVMLRSGAILPLVMTRTQAWTATGSLHEVVAYRIEKAV